MWDVIPHTQKQHNYAAFEVRAWMSSYVLLLYMNVITYRCPNTDAGLLNLC